MNDRLASLYAWLKGRFRRWLSVGVRSVVLFAFVLVLVQKSDLPPPEYFHRRLSQLLEGMRFDFVVWELNALSRKIGMSFTAPQDTLNEEQRHQLVTDFAAMMGKADQLRQEINAMYSQVGNAQAVQEAASKEQELAQVRAWLRERQDMTEGIMDEQVSTVLQAEGFGRWGHLFPPTESRFTALPLLLVISSKFAITREANVDLQAGLPLTGQEMLEHDVDHAFDMMVSLVTPIGGLSAYPAMILETDSLVWLTDTFAHEWTHQFLIFHPLGQRYSSSSAMTSINETTASIVGEEVGRLVIEKYYPELDSQLPPVPTPPAKPPLTPGEVVPPEEAPPGVFDFNREMRQTRLQVDKLLAAGEAQEAETYMEVKRRIFVAHGYDIRKINQAYFAFYGSYATSPSSANPIGGQLAWLRAQYLNLRSFLNSVATVRNDQGLLSLLEKKGAQITR
jgi:hypothetical protein